MAQHFTILDNSMPHNIHPVSGYEVVFPLCKEVKSKSESV